MFLLVEVIDAVNLIGGVHGEGYAVQGLFADDARETDWVVRPSSGSQNAVQNGLLADGALLQGVLQRKEVQGKWLCREVREWDYGKGALTK